VYIQIFVHINKKNRSLYASIQTQCMNPALLIGTRPRLFIDSSVYRFLCQHGSRTTVGNRTGIVGNLGTETNFDTSFFGCIFILFGIVSFFLYLFCILYFICLFDVMFLKKKRNHTKLTKKRMKSVSLLPSICICVHVQCVHVCSNVCVRLFVRSIII
jgi:hypothetical protein